MAANAKIMNDKCYNDESKGVLNIASYVAPSVFICHRYFSSIDGRNDNNIYNKKRAIGNNKSSNRIQWLNKISFPIPWSPFTVFEANEAKGSTKKHARRMHKPNVYSWHVIWVFYPYWSNNIIISIIIIIIQPYCRIRLIISFPQPIQKT